MSVLQTDALGHLAIPPKLACGAEYTENLRIRQAKIEFFLSFLSFSGRIDTREARAQAGEDSPNNGAGFFRNLRNRYVRSN